MFERQFIISRGDVRIPDNFENLTIGEWQVSYDQGLPVSFVLEKNVMIACLIGTPIVDGELILDHTQIDCDLMLGNAVSGKVEALLEQLAGRFVLVTNGGEVYPDHFSTMSMVFLPEKDIAASTINLLEHALSVTLARKEKTSYFPLSLTHAPGVRRLIANHCVALDGWSISRFWPRRKLLPDSAANIRRHINSATTTITKNVEACARALPIVNGLTSGRDSRVLLACSSTFARNRCTFYTWAALSTSYVNKSDVETAKLLARKYALKHSVLHSKMPSRNEREKFDHYTGTQHSKHNAAYYTTNFSSFYKNAVSIFGFGGEVAVAYYVHPNDSEYVPTGRDVLSRMEVEVSKEDELEFRRWETSLPVGADGRLAVELAYIENRISAWASPKLLAVPFRASVIPFADRNYIEACFALPYEFRQCRESQRLMMESIDPSLVSIPFGDMPRSKRLLWKLMRNRFWKLNLDL